MAVGIGIKKGFRTSDSRSVAVVKRDKDLIAEAIHRIINTSPGERLHNPTLGCRIQEILFEGSNALPVTLGSFFLSDAIERAEPRVRVVEITPQLFPEEKRLLIEVKFVLIDNPDELIQTSVILEG